MNKRPGYSPEVRERAVRLVWTGEQRFHYFLYPDLCSGKHQWLKWLLIALPSGCLIDELAAAVI